jgi:hypothetical protein
MLVDGDVLQIRDRDQIRLQDKIILTDGTTVNPDGSSRGDRLRLRNGECLDMNGVKYSNEYQYRSKIKQESKKSYPKPDDGTQSGTFSFNCN